MHTVVLVDDQVAGGFELVVLLVATLRIFRGGKRGIEIQLDRAHFRIEIIRHGDLLCTARDQVNRCGDQIALAAQIVHVFCVEQGLPLDGQLLFVALQCVL